MKTKRLPLTSICSAAIILVVLGLASSAFAASQIWTNAPVSADWTNNLNWVAKGVPGAINPAANALNGDTATFNSALSGGIGGSGNPIINDQQRDIKFILFDTANCGSYVIGAVNNNVLQITSTTYPGGNVTINSTVVNPQVINAPINTRLASSVSGGFSFVNNSTTPTATLSINLITNSSASSRPMTFFLDGSNTGNNTIGHIDDNAGANGAILITKNGAGTWVFPNANDLPQKTSSPSTGSGVASVTVNAGKLVVQNAGSLGAITMANLMVTNTGVLQIDGVTLNNTGITLNQGGTIKMNGAGTVNGVTVGNVSPTSVTLSTTSLSDLMSAGSASSKVTGGAVDSVLNISGPGTVALGYDNNYIGNWSVNSGTLVITNTSSLGTGANINLAAGAILDATPLGAISWNPTTTGLSGTGTGTTVGSTSATIKADPSATIDLASGAKVINLKFTPASFSGDTTHPALYVSQGTLQLGGNLITVSNATVTPLGVGTYRLIQQASGSVIDGGSYSLAVLGAGLASGTSGQIQVSGGNVNLVVSSYAGANLTWQGDGGNNYWDLSSANFTNNSGTPVTFSQGDFAVFNDTSANTTVNLFTPLQPGSVTVTANANSYVLSDANGNGFLSGAGGIIKNGSSTLTIATANINTGPTVINGGTVQVGNNGTKGDLGSGNITNNGAVVFYQTDNHTVSGVISGNGSLTQQGGGTVTLATNNTYSGPTTITSGSLRVGNGGTAGSLGSGSVTNDGTLIFNKSGSFTVGNIKTGPANGGTLVFNGPGTATLNNGNTYRNNTFINNGVVQLGAVDAIPSAATMVGSTGWLILDGGATSGTLDLNGLNPVVNALAGLNGAAVGLITNSASGTGTNVLTIDSTADTGYAGRIAGNSGGAKIALVKTGPYTEFLTGSSAFTGGVIISNGVLAISQGTSLGTGMITLKGGTLTNTASLNLYNVADLTVPAGQTGLLGMIGNFKMPNLFGAGNLGLNVGGVNAGAGSGSYGNAFGGCVNFLGTMNVTGTVANARLVLNYNNSSGASSDGQLQNATVNLYNGVSLVGLCFSGGGTVQLGALYVDSTSALGGSFNGGGLIYQIGALGGSSTIDGVVSNGIVGSAAITKVGSGTLTMNGSLTYTGPTTINGGTLALAGSANLDSGATITVASNSVLDVTGITFNLGNTKSQTLSGAGVVNGNINLGTSFLSTLSLTGTNNGSLTAVGPNALVSSGGSAAATLTVANDATFNDQSILAVSLSLNTTPGGGTNDLVKVGGNLSLAGGSGALYVRPQFLNGTPAIGQPYTIITYGGALTGDTNNLALDPSTFGYSHLGAIFNTSTPGVVTVSFTASPENIVWRGNYTNSWEASAMTNWLNGAATTNYYQFDNVTFNDAASNFVVSLNGLLTPSAVTVSNSANDYVFTNDLGGTLSGGIVLNKRGSGKLTLYTANPYTGGTTITNGGTVDISAQSAALGSGTLTMNGGTIISSVGGNGNPFPNKIILGSGTTNVLISNLGANTVYTNLSGGGGAALLQFQGASPDINNTNNFVGTIELTGASPTTTMRMRNEASASANVVWNIGNVGDTLGALIGGASNLKLGALVGGVSSTLGGYESGGGGAGAAVTWEIGALGQSTTFAGKIRDGNQTSGANTTAITKVGAGTLTLTGTNTYTGNTTVSNGTLELAQSVATLATNSTVAISSGAFLKLTAGSVTNQVAGLITNGVAAGNGLYTSANSSGYIIGSGQLRVGPAPTQPAIEPIQTSYNAGTGQLTLTWNNAGWTLQAQTNTLSTGLNPAGWVGVAGASSPYVISVNPTQPTVFYRLFAP